jgi:4-hydroxybenzoate polyprenyltransferase
MRLVTLLSCSSCRFATYYWIPFLVAIAASSQLDWRWALLGPAFWLVFSTGTELLNRLSDRREDAINRPERTAMCRAIGYDRIAVVVACIWAAVAAVDLAWSVVNPNPWLIALLALGFLSSINYSYGLRLKRHRYGALLTLTFPFGGTFLTGLAAHPDGRVTWASAAAGFLHDPGPMLVVVAAFIVSLAGTKDITDAKGDAVVGYRSLWVALSDRSGARRLAALLATPFVLIILLSGLGMLPPRFALLLCFGPVSALLGLAICRSTTAESRLATRELMYQYWYAFVATALYLYRPSGLVLTMLAVSTAYWLVTSRYLHWFRALDLAHAQTLLSVLGLGHKGVAVERPVQSTNG